MTDRARTVAEVVGETLGKHGATIGHFGGLSAPVGCSCMTLPEWFAYITANQFPNSREAHRDHQAQVVAAALRDAGWVK